MSSSFPWGGRRCPTSPSVVMPSPTAGNSAVFALFRNALGITNLSALRARSRSRDCSPCAPCRAGRRTRRSRPRQGRPGASARARCRGPRGTAGRGSRPAAACGRRNSRVSGHSEMAPGVLYPFDKHEVFDARRITAAHSISIFDRKRTSNGIRHETDQTTQHAVRHLRQDHQRPGPLRRRTRRARTEPPCESRTARPRHQVLDAERPHWRPAHQRRPRPLPCRHPRSGPPEGAGERAGHRRGPRSPAPLGPKRADLRGSRREGDRDPRPELEARRPHRERLARHAARLHAAPARRHACRRHHRQGRHGRAAADLDRQGRPREASARASAL